MGEHGPARWQGSGKRSVRATTQSAAPSDEPAYVEPEATDAAKALADEHGVDLNEVKGTGADDKIVKGDVEAVVAEPLPSVEEPPVETS